MRKFLQLFFHYLHLRIPPPFLLRTARPYTPRLYRRAFDRCVYVCAGHNADNQLGKQFHMKVYSPYSRRQPETFFQEVTRVARSGGRSKPNRRIRSRNNPRPAQTRLLTVFDNTENSRRDSPADRRKRAVRAFIGPFQRYRILYRRAFDRCVYVCAGHNARGNCRRGERNSIRRTLSL